MSDDVAALSDSFDALHQAVFAVNQPGETLETVSWRGDVRIARPKPALPSRRRPSARPPRRDHAHVCGPTARGATFRCTPAARLPVGSTVTGPAIIEEPTTTIVLPDGAIATVRPGHYLVEVAS